MGWGAASGATAAETDEVFSTSMKGPMNDIRTTKIDVATAVTSTRAEAAAWLRFLRPDLPAAAAPREPAAPLLAGTAGVGATAATGGWATG